MKRAAVWLGCLLAACSGPVDDGQFEVAAELRALRLTMQQQGAAISAKPPETSRQEVAEALRPLREVLEQLVREQRELATRQLVLSEALQQQASLQQAEAGAGLVRGELQGLAERLREVEATLQAQDARHREVETMLGRALDHASEQLEQFLRRLPRPPGAAEPAATPPMAPGATPSSEGALPKANGASPEVPKVGALDAGRRVRAREFQQPWWWLLLVGGAAASVLGYCWRLRSRPVGLPSAAPETGFDRGAEELWTAARLLGEPADVGSLPGGTPAPVEEFGLDESPIEPSGPDGIGGCEPVAPVVEPQPAAPAAAPQAGPEATAEAPPLLCWRLPHGDPAAAAAAQDFLAADARVLRRPAPGVAVVAGGLEVRCRVLPGLPPGERTALFLALRAAVLATGAHSRR